MPAWHEGPKARDHPQVAAYIADLDDAQRGHVEALRALVKGLDPAVVEGIAWGVPFWFRAGPLCYASAAKRHVTVGLARGVEVTDTSGRLVGTGRSPIRKCVVRLDEAFPEGLVRGWLEQALAFDGLGE